MMVDLHVYRMRIGLFSHGIMYKNAISFNSRTHYRGSLQLLPIVFICLVGFLSIQLRNDPSIETNPGPSQLYSAAEKSLIDKLKNINKDIAHISSHQFFSYIVPSFTANASII